MTTNEDTVKAAATRMCKLLGDKGVPVKHSLMLEALATGFGLDNWRTLKAVIDAPRAPEVEPLPPLGTYQDWIVDAVYSDNDQPYCDTYSGRTALEAAYTAIMERLTDGNLDIGIYVVAREDKKHGLYPNNIHEYAVDATWYALKELANALTLNESDLAGNIGVSYRWLNEVVRQYRPSEEQIKQGNYGPLDDLVDCDNNEAAGKYGSIGDQSNLTPTEALLLLCDRLEAQYASVMAMENSDEKLACICHQVRAMCGYFESALNDPDVSLLTDIDFE